MLDSQKNFIYMQDIISRHRIMFLNDYLCIVKFFKNEKMSASLFLVYRKLDSFLCAP